MLATRKPTPDGASAAERAPEWAAWSLAIACAIAGGILCLSTVLQALSGEQLRHQAGAELLLAPGAFLIRSLRWAAILVPLHLYAVAYAVARPGDARVATLHLALPVAVLLIPIAASLDHILTLTTPPPLPAILVDTVGRLTGVLLLLGLLAVVAAAVVVLSGVAPKLRVPVALLAPPDAASDAADEAQPEAGTAAEAAPADDTSAILQTREPFQQILGAEPPASPAPPEPPRRRRQPRPQCRPNQRRLAPRRAAPPSARSRRRAATMCRSKSSCMSTAIAPPPSSPPRRNSTPRC